MFGRKQGRGAIVIGGVVVADTIQCCHCGYIFEYRAGSGKKRGWCFKCNAMTCGREKCDVCIPYEVQIEFMEGNINSANRKYYEDWLKINKKYNETKE